MENAWIRRIAGIGLAIATGVYTDSVSAGAIVFFSGLWVNTALVECAHAAQECALRCAYIVQPKKDDK
jgi:uncharacterized membrane protein YhiD involved in acid resistance